MTDTPPLAGQVVVFAGTLSRMSRREATALVERQLGRVATAVTRETTMLVVDAAPPEQGSPDERRVAEAMKLNARYPGRVRLLTEDEFYDLVMAGSGDPGAALYTTRAIRGLYPALRDDHLRYLERWGLIRPVSRMARRVRTRRAVCRSRGDPPGERGARARADVPRGAAHARRRAHRTARLRLPAGQDRRSARQGGDLAAAAAHNRRPVRSGRDGRNGRDRREPRGRHGRWRRWHGPRHDAGPHAGFRGCVCRRLASFRRGLGAR